MKIKKTLGIFLIILLKILTSYGQNQLFINEFLASNSTVNVDPDFSTFSDWIEIYNAEEFDVDLSGYFLTDNLSNPNKWQIPSDAVIPSKGYLVFWADDENMADLGMHTNFKLSADGEEIGLFDDEGNLIDSRVFGEQETDVSFGRNLSSYDEWLYFSQSTPGTANNTAGYPSLIFSSIPGFSHQSGIFDSPLQLVLSVETSNSSIRYTTDGSNPNENSLQYFNPIEINSTAIIRARVFEAEKLPGNTITHSFIFDNNVDLPVFSIVTNPDFLWGEETGIYVYEDIERRKDWVRPIDMEYFDTPNSTGFSTKADIGLFGNTAYLLPQKSLAVFPNSQLNYHLFTSKEITTFNSFILRSSSDDWSYTMFRDAMIQSLIPGKLILDYQAYQPSIVYLNGQYYGIHNIREKYNKDYLASNHGIDPDSIDLLALSAYSADIEIIEGDAEHYNSLMNFIVNNNMALDENFDYVKTLMDIDDFIDWCIIENFIQNISWKHNIKIWRPKTAYGKWKWLLFDTDRGYVTPDDTLIADFYQNEIRFQRLLNNTNFKNEFLQRYSSHINISFKPERVTGIIDSIKAAIEPEMPNHILRWADSGGVQSMDYWETQINVLKNFANYRKNFVFEQTSNFFELNGTANLKVNITGFDYGTVRTHGVIFPYPDSVWVYFKDIPIHLEAVPKFGYEFVGWEGISEENEISVTLEGDSTITAIFKPLCNIPTTITNDQILLAACSPYIINDNIIVEPGATLFAEPGVVVLMNENIGIFVYGQIEFNGSEQNPIKISSQNSTGNWKGIICENSKIFLNYVEITKALKTINSMNCEIEIKNCKFYETMSSTGDMIAIYQGKVNIDYCELFGSIEPVWGKRDGIDCDEITSGIIANNNISDFLDDGIDIGTGSLNVTIENNNIENCKSTGISVGESSTVNIIRNIVANCEVGIQAHTEATGYIENNTLYSNNISLKCYHYDDQPTSGGNAFVTNSIFSNSIEEVFKLVENSTLSITYSLSNTDSLSGDGNLFGDPGFCNPTNSNYSLLHNSLCIDSGNPSSPFDPDGTRIDIGALYYDQNNSIQNSDSDIIMVYPNPTFNKITILLLREGENILKTEVFNISGEKMFSITNIFSPKKIIDLTSLSKGIYVLSIMTTFKQYYVKKIVIN